MACDLNVGQLSEALKNFFLKQSRKKVKKCELCVEKNGLSKCGTVEEFPLSEEEVGVVLSALSVPQMEMGLSRRTLWMCGECASKLTAFVELFMRLEELKVEFNELRRKVWKGIILGALGKKKATWDVLEKELTRLENVDPSVLFGNVKKRDVGKGTMSSEGSHFSHQKYFCKNQNLLDDDAKLKKMRPVVMLEQQKSTQNKIEVIPRIKEVHSCKIKNELESDGDGVFEDEKDEEESVTMEDVEIKIEVLPDEIIEYSDSVSLHDTYEEDKLAEETDCRDAMFGSPKEPSNPDEISRHPESVASAVAPKLPPAQLQTHPCSQCDLTFRRRYDLFRHIEEIHEKEDSEEEEERQRRFQCSLCPKSYFKAPDLWRHKIIKHPEIMQRPCPSCEEVFDRDFALLEHRKKVHNFVPPPPLNQSKQCSICLRIFSKAEHCRRHVANIHKNISRDFRKCPHCPASFRQPKWLRRHFYLVHPEIHLKKKPLPCLVCFHTFASNEELECHMERHASLKCPTCAKYLPTTVHLKKHLKVHERWKTT